MKLIKLVKSEIRKLLIGYAFDGDCPEVYPKAYLRLILKNLMDMRAELIERLHGVTPLYTGSDVSTASREVIIKGIMDSITAMIEVLVEESKSLILKDIILKNPTPYASDAVLHANLPGDESETLYAAKRVIMPQNQIIKEFIFHVFLGTHKQLPKCEYRIIKLIGLCKQDDYIYLLTEYAEFGNLLDVTLRPENKIRHHERVLLHDEWYYLLNDILIAMRHLHGCHVLHRNLCITNVLVRNNPETMGYQALVADLGSAALYNEEFRCEYPPLGIKYGNRSFDYETICGTTLNYRISPPEVVHSLKFSAASESYMFGVLIWRLLFDGRLPYENAEDLEWFLDHINCGYHLEIDEEWDDSLKVAMKRFLSFDPEERPLLELNSTMMLLSSLENPITELSYGLKELRERCNTASPIPSSSEAIDVAANEGTLRCILQ